MSASPEWLALLTADFERVAKGGSFVSAAEVPALLALSLNRDPSDKEIDAIRAQCASQDGQLGLNSWLQIVGVRKECKGSVNFDKGHTR